MSSNSLVRGSKSVADTIRRFKTRNNKPSGVVSSVENCKNVCCIQIYQDSVRPFTTRASHSINTEAKSADLTWVSSIKPTNCGIHVDYALPPNFSKILIANRGEIACRIIRTCRALGIKTVAVYSDADANALFVKMADEAYNVGPAPSAQSYLRGDYIIEIAKKSGAQAIHPGYGFLSENEFFAKACFDAGVEFIGPPVPAIHAMGSKSASKNIMNAAGVRCVPGYHGEDQSDDTLFKEAAKTGYPIMLKAVLGGGGKGMRIVWKPEEFKEALESCRREALASFKDERVLLERYIQNPRHIEFQVFADKQGNAVHLFERDCSVQRRHQKVFEEAPAPGMTEELREQMGKSATDAAKAVGYVGAGTVEFIVDADTNEYFFMEMNTRLQVEHCVSEMVVHRDLVQWQLHVAAGYPIPVKSQADIRATGHALELRVYAEDPYNNFFPSTGKLTWLRPPALSSDVRVETGVREGDEVSIHYDPMISKLVVWGPNRELCLKRMIRAIDDYEIVGPPTNLTFAKNVLNNKAFMKGGVTTKFIATYLDEIVPKVTSPSKQAFAASALDILLEERDLSSKESDIWGSTSPYQYRVNDDLSVRSVQLEVSGQGTGDKKDIIKAQLRFPSHIYEQAKPNEVACEISFDQGKTWSVLRGSRETETGRIYGFYGDHKITATVARDYTHGERHIFSHGHHDCFRIPLRKFGASLAAGAGAVAPMAGKVVKVNVKPGDVVVQGQPLVIMEAMKMEHVIRSAEPGVVKSVLYLAGDFVEGGKAVVTFEEKNE